MRARILIFAKAPVEGLVKTRLVPALGEQGAAELAGRMLDETCRAAAAVMVAGTELCADPDPATWERLPRLPEQITAQGEGDLGERLARAAERVIAAGDSVILIGTDCPALTTRRLRQACWELESHDSVIHPAHDGGYALLGLTKYDRSLFTDIAWSTSTVARTTIGRLKALGWSMHLGETLHDIDDPADLQHLPAHLLPR